MTPGAQTLEARAMNLARTIRRIIAEEPLTSKQLRSVALNIGAFAREHAADLLPAAREVNRIIQERDKRIAALEAELAEWRAVGKSLFDDSLSSAWTQMNGLLSRRSPPTPSTCPFPNCNRRLPAGTELHHGAWHAGEELEPLPAGTPETKEAGG